MTTLFISDIHLRVEDPLITTGFLRFLRSEALNADALYILGDLFEFWIGDDDPNQLHRDMASAIKILVNHGVPCYFIHGNRDFLIGQRFAQESGMKLLNGEQVIEVYGYKILIMHGDILCTDDLTYQAFRTRTRVPWVQKLFLSMPLFMRNIIANKMRNYSKAANRGKLFANKKISLKSTVKVMEKHKVQWLIYGHTHNSSIHEFTVNGYQAFSIVLGSWDKKGSVAKLTPRGGIELIHFFYN